MSARGCEKNANRQFEPDISIWLCHFKTAVSRLMNNKTTPSSRSVDTWGMRSKFLMTNQNPTNNKIGGNKNTPQPISERNTPTQAPIKLLWLLDSMLNNVMMPANARTIPTNSILRSAEIPGFIKGAFARLDERAFVRRLLLCAEVVFRLVVDFRRVNVPLRRVVACLREEAVFRRVLDFLAAIVK